MAAENQRIVLDGSVSEIPLSGAPLVRVIAQVQFPTVPELVSEAGVSELRGLWRDEYPVTHQDRTISIVVSSAGLAPQGQGEQAVWRFQDRKGDWQVSVSDEFVALETTKYDSRDDFCSRFESVISVVSKVASPVVYERLGLRYVDRLEGDLMDRVPDLVHGALLGVGSYLPEGARLEQSITQTQIEVGDHRLIARWGTLPARAIIDPAIPPTESASWILDLDVFVQGRWDFDSGSMAGTVRRNAEIAYGFFRWAVTPNLIEEFGGDL